MPDVSSLTAVDGSLQPLWLCDYVVYQRFIFMLRFALLIVASLLLSACALNPFLSSSEPPPPASAVTLPATGSKSRLMTYYHYWEGTPHRTGGMSKHGIDCSGFVYLAYRDVFGIELPRTSERQSATGKAVAPNQRQLGDLLIFKTGFKQRHVGIYIGNDQFIHVSSKRGGVTSSLRDGYWADKYRQTRRIL